MGRGAENFVVDVMAELRDVWHKFAAGQMGPDGVVAAARRACGAGVQRRAPSLVHLANLQPTQYGHVSDLFARVRGELQASAQAAQQAQPQLQVQLQTQQQAQLQTQNLQQQAAYATGPAVAYPAAAPPPGAYRMGAPGPPAPYAVAPGYGQPGAPVYMQPPNGLPPGVHGITHQEFKDLRRVGWICAVAGLLIPLIAIMAIVNGSKLSKHGDSQGTPMMVIGIVMIALTALVILASAGGS
ncbi:MAG: hypothetical protein HY827_03355 [Actinobacteria bacterium]|nr:hypothetical protein [Actinomycetota bacterium]